MQTEPVHLFMLLDMLDQILEESRLFELFAAFLSIKFTLSVSKDFLCVAAIAMIQLSEVGCTYYTTLLKE